jgi:hypothetical protein
VIAARLHQLPKNPGQPDMPMTLLAFRIESTFDYLYDIPVEWPEGLRLWVTRPLPTSKKAG